MPAGPLTMDQRRQPVLAASVEARCPRPAIVDLQRVEPVDSAGVAVLLAWKRRRAGRSASPDV